MSLLSRIPESTLRYDILSRLEEHTAEEFTKITNYKKDNLFWKRKVEYLIGQNALPDRPVDGGLTLNWKDVYEKIKNNDYFKSEYLKEPDIYANMGDVYGLIDTNNTEYIKFLMHLKLIPHHEGYSEILRRAIVNDRFEVLKFLLELPEVINSGDIDFDYLLDAAVGFGYNGNKVDSLETIKFILNHPNVPKNLDFNFLINEAFKFGNIDVVELLLTHPLANANLSINNISTHISREQWSECHNLIADAPGYKTEIKFTKDIYRVSIDGKYTNATYLQKYNTLHQNRNLIYVPDGIYSVGLRTHCAGDEPNISLNNPSSSNILSILFPSFFFIFTLLSKLS